MSTKILVDGFHIDDIETPKLCDSLEELALTPKVKELLEERIVASVVPVPIANPNVILITTTLD